MRSLLLSFSRLVALCVIPAPTVFLKASSLLSLMLTSVPHAPLGSADVTARRRGLSSKIVSASSEIRARATGSRNKTRLTDIDKEFIQVFQTDMKQFTGAYAEKLKSWEKNDIIAQLEAAEREARRLREDEHWGPRQILDELKVRDLPRRSTQAGTHSASHNARKPTRQKLFDNAWYAQTSPLCRFLLTRLQHSGPSAFQRPSLP